MKVYVAMFLESIISIKTTLNAAKELCEHDDAATEIEGLYPPWSSPPKINATTSYVWQKDNNSNKLFGDPFWGIEKYTGYHVEEEEVTE